MHLIIYGPEGSGKGTQAKAIAKKLNHAVLTSGDLVRNTAANDRGELGDKCRSALSEGKYVEDDVMFALWENILKSESSRKGFILDGFPRSVRQADFLLKVLGKNGYGIDKVIYLKLSDDEAVQRLALRHRQLFDGSSVNHDDPERVKQRLAIYREKEKDLLQYFRKRKMLIEIDGNKSVEDVTIEIFKRLNIV